MKKKLIEILKSLCQLFVKRNFYWKDVAHHTGFYRFDEKYQKSDCTFKICGVPCLAQDGFNRFVFFSETDLRGTKGLICVEKHYK